MKRFKIFTAALLAVVLCLSLTACSPRAMAEDLVIKVCQKLGFISNDSSDEQETTDVYAAQGGEITYPEDLDTTTRLATEVQDGVMYVSFNGIANRSTPYFVAGSDSVTITGYATTESTGLLEFKSALWELADDWNSASYLLGSTVYYTTGGDCYTQTVSGLTPGKRYKVVISYDSGTYYITGGMKITDIGSEELTDIAND